MSDRITQHGTVIWSGEHWQAYLRSEGEDENTGSVSLYHTRYSRAGEGTVALVDVAGDGGVSAVCTDNPELADFILEKVVSRGPDFPFGSVMPILACDIARGGDIRESPTWLMQMDAVRIEATWSGLLPPVVMGKIGPDKQGKSLPYSVLFFAEAAAISLNGRPVQGEPYIREAWRRTTGRPRSSCVFALAETIAQE